MKLNHKATKPLRTNRAECTVREKSEKIENFLRSGKTQSQGNLLRMSKSVKSDGICERSQTSCAQDQGNKKKSLNHKMADKHKDEYWTEGKQENTGKVC